MSNSTHKVVIVGGGTAGISVASRLKKKVDDIAIIEPSEYHYYQPLWTLVGGGEADVTKTRKREQKVMPSGVKWIKDAAATFDPDNNTVTTAKGDTITYEVLIVCPGIQLDWDKIDGLEDTLGKDGVSSNYTYELAPKTWEFIKGLTSGTAVFTMPAGPIKCAGAPQKIAYLACDYWREQGVLDKIDVHMSLPTPGMFGIKVFADHLTDVANDYGITVHFNSQLSSVDASTKTAHFTGVGDAGEPFDLHYDMMHVTPPQSAPDWIKSSPLANDSPQGYVDVDKHTLQHVKYPNVFSLGDAGSSPNSKTGAAVRKQAPTVATNVVDLMEGRPLSASYQGYASCPLTVSRNKMLLAEFDYSMEHTPSLPIIDTSKPRRDMWYLKKYGLPVLYWQGMLKGRA